MQKIDSLRHDIRKAEKLRRELETRVEEAMAETGKERKLRERSEEYCKQMEEETEKLRQRNLVVGTDTSATNQTHASQEIIRLKAEVEKLEVQYNESLAQQQSRYNLELASLRDQLQEAESRRDALEREVRIYVFCYISLLSHACNILVGRPEGRRPLGRPRRRWEDNIKMNLREIGFGDVDWIHWAQDRDRWRALVNTVMNLQVP
jgi:hypothetical protein